jgi:hypothetical protein
VKTNRHGIPVSDPVPAPRPRATPAKPDGACCWPDCDIQIQPRSYFGPICAVHALHIFELGEALPSQDWTNAKLQAHQRRRREAAEKAERARARKDAPGWVYYILDGGRIKIGYAVDVKARMRNRYTPSAQLLAVHPGTRALEHQMHLDFADLLADGREWFRDHPKIRAHIASVVAQFGPPDDHAYRFTQRADRPV